VPPARIVQWDTAAGAAMAEIGVMETCTDYPLIAPNLVFPTLRTCAHGSHHYPALVFAQNGSVVLFAAEHAGRFGVGVLEADCVVDASQYPDLDTAARVFLARSARER
jgi:hypothetical protein